MRNQTFDKLKAIACILIILIHCKFPSVFGDLCEALARFGVPMFFAIAGVYLVKNEDSDIRSIRSNLLRKLKKTVSITFKVWLIYTVYSFIYAMTVKYGALEWFNEKFNLFEFSRLILFNSGKFIYDFTYAFDHMWYLFALIYVYGLCYIFAPLLKKGALPISVVLIGFLYFGEFLQIYYPIRPFGISVSVWYTIRNWLFVGIPFTLLGYYIKNNNVSLMLKQPLTVGSVLTITGIFSTLMEFKKWGSVEVYFGSLLIVTGLLIAACSNTDKKDSDKEVSIVHRSLAFVGRELSSNIYFYHVLVISLLGWCIDRVNAELYGSAIFMYLRPVIVIIITILISIFIYKVKFITIKNDKNLRK
ncbi:acyltransferase family protein [Butyrivibrio sp. WCE2006]|uniref:acyltransferase family protein n=1 Tax=Butyrivibrio sp. WCE2006 TaxID=1410611 RepID=UPI0005D1F412|nr:acyltransferase family protein [Butyrivibrio sp. WCE2006]